ncbi:hypothetical protein [Crystallibacter crystallopoietes]|uniref:hypothetical protein n=1 Tax=Crystallibacter crystallopoietes TaxID=37928 RepID=UPI0012372BAD|nr:hypothetical protein [Arthrobacter crystallopoietes]
MTKTRNEADAAGVTGNAPHSEAATRRERVRAQRAQETPPAGTGVPPAPPSPPRAQARSGGQLPDE